MDEQTVGQTDMVRSIRLVILIKNIYTLWRSEMLSSTWFIFSDEFVYPLNSTGNGYRNNDQIKKDIVAIAAIKTRKNAIIEYLDYQIPVT